MNRPRRRLILNLSVQGSWFLTMGLINNRFIYADYTDDHHSLMALQLIFVLEMYLLVVVIALIGFYKYYTIKNMRAEEVSACLDLEGLNDDKSELKNRIEYLDGSNDPIIYTKLPKDIS